MLKEDENRKRNKCIARKKSKTGGKNKVKKKEKQQNKMDKTRMK
jgi:hypothetical protein